MKHLNFAFIIIFSLYLNGCLPYIPIDSETWDKVVSKRMDDNGQIVEVISCKIQYVERQYLIGPDGPVRQRKIANVKYFLKSSEIDKRLTFVEDFSRFPKIIPISNTNKWIAIDFREDKDDKDKPEWYQKYDKKGIIQILIFNEDMIIRKDIISNCRLSYYYKNGKYNFRYNESKGQLVFNIDGEQVFYGSAEIRGR